MTETSPRTPCSDRSATKRVPLIGTEATADIHQGAQPPCCNPDAVYMAATVTMPTSTEKPLPRGSHPYRVQEQWSNAIEVDFSLPGERVVEMLERVARERGYPDILVVDNGPELRGRALDGWADDHGVQLYFIDPFVGKTAPHAVF